MNKCPICKSYLDFEMKYNFGQPIVIKSCSCCGYTSLRPQIISTKVTLPYMDRYSMVNSTNYN